MNGYQKMKMARGLKVTKVVSAVTAMSMAVTSLIVAASADSITSDEIQNALGNLRDYGIVANKMETHSHFESNFAVKNLELNNNFDVHNVLPSKTRTIEFSITTDEKFEDGEVKYYYYGVYCNGSPVSVTYQTSEGTQTNDVVAVRFDEPGTRNFVISVPSSNPGDTLVVHRLMPQEIQEMSETESAPAEAKVTYVPADEGETLQSVSETEVAENIISDTIQVAGEAFSSNKVVYVGPEIYKDIKEESDGRISYCNNIIANNTNEFYEDVNAGMKVDELMGSIKSASDALKNVNSNGNKSLYYEVSGSVYPDTSAAYEIIDKYNFVKNNPDYSLLVNVRLNPGEENVVKLNSAHQIGTWDSDASSRIVFNFIGGDPNTTVVLDDGFRGTVVAPDANVRVGATICGAVYAPNVNVQNGEVHAATYNFLSDSYSAYYVSPEETTPETTTEEITTVPETTPETTVPETTPETTVPETTPETTVPETTPETTVPETTPETTVPETTPETTTQPPETTPVTTTEPPVTTTEPPVTTTEPPATTTEPPVTTTEPPVTTTEPPVTTTEPPATTTEPPVTTTEPVVTTTEPVVTTTEPVVTTTEPVVTTTEPVVTTTEPVVTTTEPVVTTTEPVVTTTEPVVTTTEPVVTTTEPVVTTSEPVEEPPVTTTELIEIEEEVPRDVITIDEEVPLADLPMNTGVDSHIGMFAAIGGGALLVGGGAQAYSVFLKKKK